MFLRDLGTPLNYKGQRQLLEKKPFLTRNWIMINKQTNKQMQRVPTIRTRPEPTAVLSERDTRYRKY